MELTSGDIYLIGIVDSIRVGFMFAVPFFLGLIFLGVMAFADEKYRVFGGFLCVFSAFMLIGCFTGAVLTPNSKTLAAMKILPAVANNAQIQGITKHALELTDEFLRDMLTEQIKKRGKSE